MKCFSGTERVSFCRSERLEQSDETYSEYSLAPTADLMRFWRSKVKVTAGCRDGKGIHVDAVASKSIF